MDAVPLSAFSRLTVRRRISVMPDSIELLNKLPRAASSFFVFFSRFEFALKRTGHLKADKKRAEPDRPRFTSDLGDSFLG